MNCGIIKKILLAILVCLNLIFLVNQYLKPPMVSICQQVDTTLNRPPPLNEQDPSPLNYVHTRDFMRYECERVKRVGGLEKFTKYSPHPTYRIDGAWFVCADRDLELKSDCIVLSFGVRDDYSFDRAMSRQCRTFSFDPFEEAQFFTDIRLENKRLNSIEIRVDNKWSFYRIGISRHNSQSDINRLKIGDLLNLTMILKLIHIQDRIIDVFKMDIDGAEKDVLKHFDMTYACSHIKQLMFETHGNFRFADLVKLERCFLMFRRDTRFFLNTMPSDKLGLLTEFQAPKGFSINLKDFVNETFLSEFMFVNGELYFVNKNFLN